MAATDSRDDESSPHECLDQPITPEQGNRWHQATSSVSSSSSGGAEFLDQSEQGLAQVIQSLGFCASFAVGSNVRTQLGVSAPNAVFVLLDNVGHVYDFGHRTKLPW